MTKSLILLLMTGTLFAGQIQYALTAPAITTGTLQADAFSLTFTTSQLLTATTDLSSVSNLSYSGPLDPQHPNFLGGTFFAGLNGGINVDFGGPALSDRRGIAQAFGLASVGPTGTYTLIWYVYDGGTGHSGDVVSATLNITDLGSGGGGSSPTPEPSTVVLLASGLGLTAASVRRRLRC